MATKYVSNSQGLLGAFNSAVSGDRIVLAAGNYGNVTLANHAFGGTVTLAGGGAAAFTGLAVRNVANLALEGLDLDYVPGKSPSDKPFTIDASRNVAIRNADFDGHLSGGYGTGFGLIVRTSAGITVEGSHFDKFVRGAAFLDVTGLVVRGNDMSLMSEDVMAFAQVIDARIENNHLHGMQSPPDRMHKDLIQFWSGGTTKPSANVTIRGNVLESDEPLVHGIFLGNEIGRTNKAFKYQNILIENNKIASGHVLGLAVEHSNKVIIRGNDVRIHPDVPKTAMNTPVIDVTPDSTGVTIANNTTHGLPDPIGVGWVITGNRLVSRYGEPVTIDGGTSGGSGGGSGVTVSDDGTDFPFSGKLTTDKTATLRDFDFAEGDRIILKEFATGTLKGWGGGNPLAVNTAGTYAVLDTLADVRELANASAAVSTRTTADTLVLDINPAGPGSLEIHLVGLGQEFLAL